MIFENCYDIQVTGREKLSYKSFQWAFLCWDIGFLLVQKLWFKKKNQNLTFFSLDVIYLFAFLENLEISASKYNKPDISNFLSSKSYHFKNFTLELQIFFILVLFWSKWYKMITKMSHNKKFMLKVQKTYFICFFMEYLWF